MVVSTVNLVLSSLTLITGILIVLFLFAYLILKIRKNKKGLVKFNKFIKDRGVLFVFLISLAALIGSLFFSEFAKYGVCTLCWYQRILMYPLVLISGVMLFKRSRDFLFVIIPMSAIGITVSLYHYLIQVLPSDAICDANGVSCVTKPFLTFGYISIPMMAFTAFLAIFLISIFLLRQKKI